MKLAALVAFVPKLPFFRNDDLAVIRTLSVVNGDGVAEAQHDPIQISGAVDPSQSEALTRMLEGQNLSGAIMVVTDYALSDGCDGRAADTLIWKGRRFAVTRVADYAEGGVGIRQGACTLIDINPAT